MSIIDNIKLLPGDLLIEKRNGLFGELMQFFLWPFFKDLRYQHVRVIYSDTTKVIEDGETHDKNGKQLFCVCINDAPKSLERYEVWRPLCDIKINLDAIKLMESRLGEPYGMLSIFGIYCRKFIGLNIPDFPGDFCSELVSWAWDRSGYDLIDGLKDYDSAPWELRNEKKLTRIH